MTFTPSCPRCGISVPDPLVIPKVSPNTYEYEACPVCACRLYPTQAEIEETRNAA